MSNELYVIEMRGSAGHAPQEQDEEQERSKLNGDA